MDAERTLRFLEVSPGPPERALLDRLIQAYPARVPWESASRIVRRAAVARPEDCPRWPETFWQEAITLGTGGTCFESNYAFFALLQALGFDGYLTVNDMNETAGCHTAIVVRMQSGLLLVDMGYPLNAAIPIEPEHETVANSRYHTYTLTPRGNNRFTVSQDRHPQPYMFTLKNEPVSDAAYRECTIRDYGPDGLFLSSVIANKIVNGREYRFNGGNAPAQFEVYDQGERTILPIEGDVARAFAETFGMDVEVVRRALDLTLSASPS